MVRETASLADSLQLLLETVGFDVGAFETVPLALAHLSHDGKDDPPHAIVVACNRSVCETLRRFPADFPEGVRTLPLLVVGRPGIEARSRWPSNVRFFPLPLETDSFLGSLGMPSTPPRTPGSPRSPGSEPKRTPS